MTYKWDNKKPTAQMLGRWQPFHDGHYALFQEIIKKTGQVCIQIRDVQGVDDNPFDFDTVKKNIEERLTDVLTRGIVGLKSKSLKQIYNERSPLYSRFAHITVTCQGKSQAQLAKEILRCYSNLKK